MKTFALALSAAFLACSSSTIDPVFDDVSIAAAPEMVQQAVAGSAITASARVTKNGAPAAGVRVRWTALAGTVADSATNTNLEGIARTTWTLSSTAGAQVVRAVANNAAVELTVQAQAVPEPLFIEGTPLPLSSLRHMEARGGDFDGDGDVDLIIAREFQPNALLLNDGKGVFTLANSRIPQKTRDSEDIAIADFDGDGDLDIVIVSEDDVHNPQIDLTHEYYLNDGSGQFSDVSARIGVRSESNAVVAGDIDRDGDVDLVLSNAGREIVLINDGRGFFTDESATRMPAASDGTQDVALGDVDGDGDLDLLVANDDGQPNKLYINNGSGVFTLKADAIPPRAAEITRNADFGDVDKDGDLDIFFANATYGGGAPQNRLLLNDGTGKYTDVTATHLPAGSSGSTFDGDFVDVDRDGDLDLVVSGNRGGQGAFLLINDGSGRFAEAPSTVMPFVAGGIVVEVEALDVNGDNRLDLLFSGFDTAHRLLLAK